MTPSVSAPRSVPVYMAPRIGRPSGFLPRLPSRLPPPSSVHDGVSLLRQVLLWLPPSFLRYLWHAFPATDTAVCVDRRRGGRGSVSVLAAPQGRPRCVGAAVGEGVPEVGLSGAPVTATPKRRRRTLVLGGARRGLLEASGKEPPKHTAAGMPALTGAALVVLLGCSPYCRALVRALAHVTGALTAVIRALRPAPRMAVATGTAPGEWPGVAGGSTTPFHSIGGPFSCRSHRFGCQLRRRRPQGRSTRLLTIAASHLVLP